MRQNIKLVLTAAWTMAGTASYLIVPAVAPFFLPLTLVAPILWYHREGLLRHLWAPSWLARLLAVTSAYLLINATWSLTPDRAYIGAATFFVAAIALHVVIRTMPALERQPLRAMALGFYAGYAIVAFLTTIEIIFDHPIHLRFFAAFPKLVPQMDGMVIVAGVVKSVPDFFLNRNIAALVFLIWPALLVAGRLTSSARSRAILLACLAPAIPAILASQHETSKIAIAGAAAVFCIQALAPRVGKPFLTAAWTIAFLAVVPLAYMAYDAQLYRAGWLPSSAQHRIVIWRAAAEKIAEAPLLGHGMASARALGLKAKEHPTYAPGTQYVLSPGPHTHNAYLEVWFEAGAIGALLLFSIGLLALAAISRAATDIQPALYATFAADALLAGSSFTIWGRWFPASLALSAIFALLAWCFSDGTSTKKQTLFTLPPEGNKPQSLPA